MIGMGWFVLALSSFGSPEVAAERLDPVEEYWRAVREARDGRPRFDAAEHVDARDAELRAALAGTRVPGLVFEDVEELDEVGAVLQAMTGIPVIVDDVAVEAMIDEGVVINLNLDNPLSVESALDIVTDLAGEEVQWTVRAGIVRVTTPWRARSDRVVFVHSLVDLMIDPYAFIPEEQELGDLFEPFWDDDLATLVMENVLPGSWDEDGVSLTVEGGLLTVVHTAEAHAEVEAFLNHLRSFFVPDPAVTTPGTAIAPWPIPDGRREEVLAQLEQVRLTADFGMDGEGAPIHEVAAFLQQLTGVNFLVSPEVLEELDPYDTAVEIHLPERSVREVLDIVCDVNRELAWRVEDGVVKILAADSAWGGQTLVLTDVRHLTRPYVFGGDPESPLPFAGDLLPEEVAMVMSADMLESIIRDNMSPESWDMDPNNALRIGYQGVMFVNQHPDVHEQIAGLLAHLDEVAAFRARFGQTVRPRRR